MAKREGPCIAVAGPELAPFGVRIATHLDSGDDGYNQQRRGFVPSTAEFRWRLNRNYAAFFFTSTAVNVASWARSPATSLGMPV